MGQLSVEKMPVASEPGLVNKGLTDMDGHLADTNDRGGVTVVSGRWYHLIHSRNPSERGAPAAGETVTATGAHGAL